MTKFPLTTLDFAFLRLDPRLNTKTISDSCSFNMICLVVDSQDNCLMLFEVPAYVVWCLSFNCCENSSSFLHQIFLCFVPSFPLVFQLYVCYIFWNYFTVFWCIGLVFSFFSFALFQFGKFHWTMFKLTDSFLCSVWSIGEPIKSILCFCYTVCFFNF